MFSTSTRLARSSTTTPAASQRSLRSPAAAGLAVPVLMARARSTSMDSTVPWLSALVSPVTFAASAGSRIGPADLLPRYSSTRVACPNRACSPALISFVSVPSCSIAASQSRYQPQDACSGLASASLRTAPRTPASALRSARRSRNGPPRSASSSARPRPVVSRTARSRSARRTAIRFVRVSRYWPVMPMIALRSASSASPRPTEPLRSPPVRSRERRARSSSRRYSGPSYGFGIVLVVLGLAPKSIRFPVQRRGGAKRRVPGRPEAEQLLDQGVVVRVPGRGVDDLFAVPEHEQGGNGARGLVVKHVVVRDHRHRGGGDPQVVAGHEQVKVEFDRQPEQVGLVPLVDADERLVKRDHPRAVVLGRGVQRVGRGEQRQVNRGGLLAAGHHRVLRPGEPGLRLTRLDQQQLERAPGPVVKHAGQRLPVGGPRVARPVLPDHLPEQAAQLG